VLVEIAPARILLADLMQTAEATDLPATLFAKAIALTKITSHIHATTQELHKASAQIRLRPSLWQLVLQTRIVLMAAAQPRLLPVQPTQTVEPTPTPVRLSAKETMLTKITLLTLVTTQEQ
jgi:hypothetical protein